MTKDVYARREAMKRIASGDFTAEDIRVLDGDAPKDVYERRKIILGQDSKEGREVRVAEVPLIDAFRNYDNPQMAERVWLEYSRDIKRLGLSEGAIDIRGLCSDYVGLDASLNMLVESHSRGTEGIPKSVDRRGNSGN